MLFCEYKDVLGKPGAGFHERRFMGLAANDLFGTMFIAYLISLYKGGFIMNFIYLVVLGMVLHFLFCVDSALNNKVADLFY